MEYKLCYHTPASKFSEALPLGNGSFGAMVYGNFPQYKVSLNADTLWSGQPYKEEHLFVARETIEEARRLIKEGKNYEAEQIVQERMTGRTYNESYLSAGFLTMTFMEEIKETVKPKEQGDSLPKEEEGIYRELNLNTGRKPFSVYDNITLKVSLRGSSFKKCIPVINLQVNGMYPAVVKKAALIFGRGTHRLYAK